MWWLEGIDLSYKIGLGLDVYSKSINGLFIKPMWLGSAHRTLESMRCT